MKAGIRKILDENEDKARCERPPELTRKQRGDLAKVLLREKASVPGASGCGLLRPGKARKGMNRVNHSRLCGGIYGRQGRTN